MLLNLRHTIAKLSARLAWSNWVYRLGSRLSMVKRIAVSKRVRIAVGVSFLGLSVVYAAQFYWPKTVAFSYSGPTCFTNPIALPGFVANQSSPSFEAIPTKDLTIGGFSLYSHKTCITPTKPPRASMSETLSLKIMGLYKKSFRVSSGTLPVLRQQTQLNKPISPNDTLIFKLDRTDRIFEYQLAINDQKVSCAPKDRSLACPIEKLGLAQSTAYTLNLERTFNNQSTGIALTQLVRTVDPVLIANSSVTRDQTMYDAPNELTFTLNKTSTNYKGVRLLAGDARQEIPTTATLNDKTLTVRFNQPLPRLTSFILVVDQITAPDGGYLAEPYHLPFRTSGGPKVLGINIGTTKVQPTSNIVLTFDSPVSTTQALGQFLRLEVNGSIVPATISLQDRTITLRPQNALPRCAPITVKVLDGLQNAFGITGGSAWQYKARVQCQVAFSIGRSVLGRNIMAYSFGSGPSKIIFVGGIHGDEKSSTHILNSWIAALEASGNIPAHRTIIIIPNLNPDGYAMGRRTNARNVDINRNFPANNWKSDVTMPNRTFLPGGGGAYPLSEPESASLANYVLGQDPRLVLTYHAAAGVVIPNDSGDSDALAHLYDQKSNVGYAPNSQTNSLFTYDTTGAFEDWLHDKHGIPALLVELWTMAGNEFTRHQDALWAMVNLP